MQIDDYRIRQLVFPLHRHIGDSQVGPIESFGITYLELIADDGTRGVGFDEGSYDNVSEAFEPAGDDLVGESPFKLRNRIERPRGGNYRSGRFDRMIDFALWDLCGKHLSKPVYELMGGTDPKVPAYASGLAFRHDDEATRQIYEEFADLGFTAAKVKVGYPTVEADIERIRLVQEVMGEDCRIMIDANEGFAPKEAIRRCRAYRDAGIDVYWFEDPTFREDVDGIQRVVEGLPRTHINTGEYLGLEGKRELLENGAADVLNIHGFSQARTAAQLAGTYGVPVTVGNTPAEIGVHTAASLPEVMNLEYSMIGWRELMEDPVRFEDGHAFAPDRPGHGLEFDDAAVERYEQH